MFTQAALNRHVKEGLIKLLKEEKKSKVYKKKLNILREDYT
jgi:hypothetical protein